MIEGKTGHQPRQTRRWWQYVLALGLVLILALVLLLPWGVSAYYVEHSGARLDSDKPISAAGYQAVEGELWRALAWHPRNAQAYRLLAQTYEEQGRRIATVDALAQYVALRPNDPQGYWALAIACEHLAVADLGQVTSRSCGTDEESQRMALNWLWQNAGQSAADFVRAGDRSSRSEDWSQAIAFYQRVLVLDPESATAWHGLGDAYQAQGQTEEALEAYAQVVTLSTDPSVAASAYRERGRILADVGRWLEASEELARAVELVADQGRYHLDYGWYLYRAGASIGEARAELVKAAEMMPSSPWPHLRLSNLDFEEKDYTGALAHAQMGIRANPNQVWGWIWQSQALRHLARLAEAEESARHAVELVPNNAAAHEELGHVLKELDRLDEAIEAYQQAVALAPDNVWHRLSLASAYRVNGQTVEAIQEYQSVLELAPGNTNAKEALRDLGY
jgi:tetratricopeptide (TPR) repeat protein